LGDVLAGAAQPVADGLAGGLRGGDLLVEFGELALGELPPAGRARAGGPEGFCSARVNPASR